MDAVMLLGDRSKGRLPAAGNGDLGARLGKGQGHIGADTAASTGNDGAFACQDLIF